MKISTKGRYALRVTIDIAEHSSGEFIRLPDIACRQSISEKYLEGILASLTKAGLLVGVRGKGGGYRLAAPPESLSVAAVLRAAEGSLAPVACLEGEKNSCPKAAECKTLRVWEGLERVINDYLEAVSIAELAAADGADYYCI